jgi:hypothetical protein
MGERGRVGVMRSPPARGVGGGCRRVGLERRVLLAASSHLEVPARGTTPNRGVNAAEGGVTAAVAAPHAGVSVGLPWGGVRGDGRAYGGWAAVGRDAPLTGVDKRRLGSAAPAKKHAKREWECGSA